MWTRALVLAPALCLLAGPGAAQAPLSAIDWLSNTVVAPPSGPADTADTIRTETIDVSPLEAIATDAVGLLPPRITGLPPDFWGTTPAAELVALMDTQPLTLRPPARALLHRIALAELDPPVDADRRHLLFLARIDLLLRYGALEEAQALLERAGPGEAELFRRWFDVSLLTGNEDRACATMRATPDIAPTFSARIFCLARGNDWAAAALSLETASALGDLGPAEQELMARFLDPDLFEGVPPGPPPRPMTPLAYRMLQALGEAPNAAILPIAFSHAKLGRGEGWKPRLEAAERLARRGGIRPQALFGIYTERRPAASGGIWERVAAVQAMDVALLTHDRSALEKALVRADATLMRAGLGSPFAQVFGAQLAGLALEGPARRVADAMVALSPVAENAALEGKIADPLLSALAIGDVTGLTSEDSRVEATLAAFRADPAAPLPVREEQLARQGKTGELTLRALKSLGSANSDPGDIELSLRILRRLGFESTARETAIDIVLSAGTG